MVVKDSMWIRPSQSSHEFVIATRCLPFHDECAHVTDKLNLGIRCSKAEAGAECFAAYEAAAQSIGDAVS